MGIVRIAFLRSVAHDRNSTHRSHCTAACFAYRTGPEPPLNPSLLVGQSFAERDTVTQPLVSIIKVLVGNRGDPVVQAEDRLQPSGRTQRAAQRTQVRTQAQATREALGE